ncbi:MAG: 2,3-bisphosphoglycerate-independent phosphoglycerate mutase [Candidatus Magnetobacterium sp. LHC-1]|uniref:2,3-bisphosphoglycerate-independent phosphoglycerate mutase n=1 Tax=Candidatus Magnetobacterium casense TaxID=1455061 RepID=A0ABS6RZS9_9BACT|nr:2,3-bisphosphoglycerate-independent phosphoglycerate mutase [Candidatus Magnetobacterium casensis]MBF0609258.1 2,3-bisphosphoglycerate-independent phosphoglycerate mutase [Nitrospirota bacterium]MBV6342122.1 2,3-bisphosphoglycerate-independent phosphoglycerate mutase [Candidatus Magnetobacterium casensis]
MERLKTIDGFEGRKGPLLLIIMDGVGLGREDDSNAVHLAKTPTLDRLFKSDFFVPIAAHGEAVGLPSDEDMGNSEVGHNALGAGRVFAQGAKRVNEDFATGAVFGGALWNKIVQRANNGGAVHFIGLLSDANVHSNINHLYQMIERLAESGVKKVRVHPLLDGRDVGPRTAMTYVEPVEALLKRVRDEKGFDYVIASGGGRMNVTMDRYCADWNIVKRGWDAHVHGIGRQFRSCSEAVNTFYQEGVDDQYMGAFVIVDEGGNPVGKMQDGDCAVLYNFRGDRAIELSQAFDAGSDFKHFDRGNVPDVLYAGMMEYDSEAKVPKNYIVQPPLIQQTVAEYLALENIGMFAISETQKYGHVTYFWNGNKSGYINADLETYVEITSDRIPFDQAPKMKAYEITEKTIELLKSGKFKWGRLNFANGDMVGHTGVMEAAITAVETVDECVAKLLSVVEGLGGTVIVTADHGNADEMFEVKKGKKTAKTSHTLNKVPFVIVDFGFKSEYRLSGVSNPGLSNVAATICNLLGFEKPPQYDASLISFTK